jgi:LysR family transcriptional regulator of beta-lactamase
MDAPLAPLCGPALAATLQQPEDLRRCVLLRSYRSEDWPAWAQAAGLRPLPARGPMFDSSVLMVQAAALGAGVALAPPAMFRRELREGRLVQPFALGVDTGRYWLVRPAGRRPRPALKAFERWLVQALDGLPGAATIEG